MNEPDEFYIGWQARAPEIHGRATRRVVVFFFAFALLAALGLAVSQRLIGNAVFEWGNVKEFTGVLHADPYPHLVLDQTTTTNEARAVTAPLVAPFKFGVKRVDVLPFDGRAVSLRATRIFRDDQLMLELEPQSVKLAAAVAPVGLVATISLGRQTYRGEIVDSKCWLGVMNPGVLAPHRACAVRCISGGVPPMLLVRRDGAPPLHLLLASVDGKPVNEQVIEFVAEPIEITGEVIRQDGLLILRADPATYRRVVR